MSLKKFMHERNKYKQEPNFKQLAILYPDFRKIAINDIGGKVHINFKNEESLRILTKTLLNHDFGLQVEIPPKKLVPTLPLRLNYVLWIEDLLKHADINDLESAKGIDIGTGAVCIYPLLFSKIYKSRMIASDIDPDSIHFASNNIQKNNLQDFIKLFLVNKETILEEIILDNEKYSFLMCNPPFFETDKGAEKKIKEEPPRNAPTGNENEMEVKGGEKEFILRLIAESLKYKDRVKIFTTMFGQKSSLSYLRNALKQKNIFNSTWTEFCQGFTKRWGIAWTFCTVDEINLTTAPVIRTRTEVLKMKKDKSMEIVFPAKENLNSLKELVTVLRKWIDELKLGMKEIEVDNDDEDNVTDKHPYWACQLKCYTDTWSHARRKRRMAMRQGAVKKQCNDTLDSNSKIDLDETNFDLSDDEKNSDPLLVCTLLVGEKGKINDGSEENSEEESGESKKIFRLCFLFESGHGGKLSLETLRQYLVNKLNVREYFHKQNSSKPNKKKRRKKKLEKNIL